MKDYVGWLGAANEHINSSSFFEYFSWFDLRNFSFYVYKKI